MDVSIILPWGNRYEKCILIIESDHTVGRFIQLKLEAEGFTCLQDNNGDSAVDLAGQRQIDLIVWIRMNR